MAKEKNRPSKQVKKPKTVEKKPSGPKYLRDGGGFQSGGPGTAKGATKPAGK
ncbi:MAG: hypothetical protein KIS96_07050 [Bauldia sp.]|nr:hypothetical protein [Bauldia sp.]